MDSETSAQEVQSSPHKVDLYKRYFHKNQKNELIIRKFEELLSAIEIEKLMEDSKEDKRRHEFRLFSIRRGLNRIRQVAEPIVHGESLLPIYGIGDGIINRVNEILLTGDLAELRLIVANPMVKAVLDLKTVHGLGEILAKKIYIEHGIETAEELRRRTRTHPTLKAKDSEIIEVSSLVKLGLTYYDEIAARIPRQEIAETYEIIKEILFKKDPMIISECCGSYRRGKETSSDIDIIISHPHVLTEYDLITRGGSLLSYLINELQKQGLFELALNAGLSRFQGLIRTAQDHVRRSDIIWVPYDCYYASLLYLTGSDIFNRLTRCIAHRKGYTMSNWGLYPHLEEDDKKIRKIKRNKAESPTINFDTMSMDSHAPSKYLTASKVEIHSEEEIFKLLDIKWLPPNERV